MTDVWCVMTQCDVAMLISAHCFVVSLLPGLRVRDVRIDQGSQNPTQAGMSWQKGVARDAMNPIWRTEFH